MIPPGARWDKDIERELKSAACVVVLWTHNSRESEWVVSEASLALKRNLLFPILVDEAEPPLEFLRRQAAKISTASDEAFKETFESVIQSIVDTSRKRSLVVSASPSGPTDWRFSGGFEPSDQLLSSLPESRPSDKTRYELCRSEIEKSGLNTERKALNFRERAKLVFEQFTAAAVVENLPNQRDATTALLLAHQLTEEYAAFGKALRSAPADKRTPENIQIPRCFNRVYLNTVNSFVKDIFHLITDREKSRELGLRAQEQDIAAASRHIIKYTRIEPRRSGEKAFAGPEIHATYTLGRLRPNLPFMSVQEMLGKFESRLDKRLATNTSREDDVARQLRLMRRTVLLSRSMLGSKESLKRYISLVQNSFLEADVNAGFHLEYYCDLTRDEQLPLCSRDEGQACGKTIDFLSTSLQRALDSALNRAKHPLYLVEAYTLASIIARRLHGMHDGTVRQALPIIEKLHERIEDADTKTFLELLLDVASSGPDFPDIEFEKWPRKSEQRYKWKLRA